MASGRFLPAVGQRRGGAGTDAATIPCDIPYLWADPDLTERWRQELAAAGGLKVGIFWQGSRFYSGDRWRSIPLASFAPLGCLQWCAADQPAKGFWLGADRGGRFPGPSIFPTGSTKRPVRSWTPWPRSAILDLVVTADTAIAHLVGPLGVAGVGGSALPRRLAWLEIGKIRPGIRPFGCSGRRDGRVVRCFRADRTGGRRSRRTGSDPMSGGEQTPGDPAHLNSLVCWPSRSSGWGGWPKRPRPIARFWRSAPTWPRCTTTWELCWQSKARLTRLRSNSAMQSP